MGTNYAPLLSNIFLYSYESEFIEKLIKDKNKVERLKPIISLPGILMMFCQLIMRNLLTGFH
jgi:hypothetical protein